MTAVSAATLMRLHLALAGLVLRDRPAYETARRAAAETSAALHYRRRRDDGEALPRLRLLCGPSGGGKSSLFNALVGRELSRVSSVERPATRGAVCALGGGAALDDVMPTLPRVGHAAHPGGESGSVVELSAPDLGFQILIDGPDYDSRDERNRALVELVLPWADEVVLVTSLERYGDRSAAPFLARLKHLQTPIVAILNKTESEAEDALADFLKRIDEMGGPPPHRAVSLARRPEGIDPQAAVLNELRAPPAATGPSETALCAEIDQLARDEILPELGAWRRDIEALRADLDGLLSFDDNLHDDGRLRQLENYEEESKFWLRYSPRGLLRGLRELARDPGRMFRSNEVPHEPDEAGLLEHVLEQARRVDAAMLVRARETLKRHRPGRLLISEGGLVGLANDPEALAERMRPIARDLHEFGRDRIEAFKKEWSRHRHGLVARARFWAIDKVLRLLGLCLTLAVLPPLIWELLRFIGHPAFTNEVTAEFHRTRDAFREAMAELEAANLRATMAAVEALGPGTIEVDEFRAALAAVVSKETPS